MNFEQLIKQRRSIYKLNSNINITVNKLSELISSAIFQCPSAFNSQSGRIMLLLNNQHLKLWQITLQEVIPLTTSKQLKQTQDKIDSFAAGFGTILFFNDTNSIKELQTRFPLYANNIPTWSEQSQGMLQFIVWALLAEHNIGASLQHYNSLIEDKIITEFNIPTNWKLSAQMPFGGIDTFPEDKTYLPIDERIKILGDTN